jgi:branched-chain amino acid transport system permease protein
MSLAMAEFGLSKTRALKLVGIGVLVLLPFLGAPDYFMHILIQVLIWAFVYTSWAVMGRFGIVSLGHGAFMGIGAYAVALLWNFFGVTPWLGIPIGIILAVFLALLVGYPCFRFRIVGHYFALVTLALGEVVRLTIIALRDYTGGSLGLTPNRYGEGTSWYALQFADKEYFYAIALIVWLAGIGLWVLVERSMMRYALIAVEEDEDAAASVGIHVTVQKLYITALSAALTALGGGLYMLYQAYVNPNSVSGIVVSLHIVFAAIVGGMFIALGPTVGALFTIALSEGLRISFGAEIIGLDNTIYGILLILFIIFLPKGILGSALDLFTKRRFGAGGSVGGRSDVGATASKAGGE